MAEAGRIVAGAARGIRLRAPGEGTRPFADRVKQSLFAALEAGMATAWETPVLDLCAGSGAAGLEALSRGAPVVVLVERDPGAVRTIEENVRRTRLAGAIVVRRDALRFLAPGAGAAEAGAGGPFGLVIADPPYAETELLAGLLGLLGDATLGWLRDDAVVVAKHFWKDAPPERVGDLVRARVRRFGETALTEYHREVAG